MIIYAGPSLLVRLLDPAQAATFAGSAEVQIVSSAQALAECTADAVADGLARGMTPEGALARLGDLVAAEDGLVEILGVDEDEVEASAAEITAQTGVAAGHAWHLAVAELCFTDLAEPGEARRFGADDGRQAAAARARGWSVV
ncbi:hypothetical protein [Cryobacterium melibiosiphilum]|uniref:hypothetical protein n=1 Tax=Cryobacterium melibiosiphilum TaxID=995039 RepID=UPI001F3C38B3|nr:hypothetical protein [Cryobacterium melibiosiphilum]